MAHYLMRNIALDATHGFGGAPIDGGNHLLALAHWCSSASSWETLPATQLKPSAFSRSFGHSWLAPRIHKVDMCLRRSSLVMMIYGSVGTAKQHATSFTKANLIFSCKYLQHEGNQWHEYVQFCDPDCGTEVSVSPSQYSTTNVTTAWQHTTWWYPSPQSHLELLCCSLHSLVGSVKGVSVLVMWSSPPPSSPCGPVLLHHRLAVSDLSFPVWGSWLGSCLVSWAGPCLRSGRG